MKLSNRLLKITEFINKEDIVIDVGSDHGYLPCFLMLNNMCKKAYASDNKVGPINHAKESIAKYKVNVDTILADGLKGCPNDADTVVIAGMGDLTAIQILEGYDLKQFKKIIVQVNKNVNNLRKWISNNGYNIIDEGIVYEDGHYYEIEVFELKNGKELNDLELKYGPINLNRKDESFIEYLNFLKHKYTNIYALSSNESLLEEIKIIESLI